MKRRVPRLRTDEEAEAFLESDLSEFDFSQFKSGRLRLEERPGRAGKAPAASEVYRFFEQAMFERKQIICEYDGYHRELCPIILGHSQGKEKALTFQFGGESRTGLPPGGEWRCLFLSDVSNVRLREGPWRSGDSHKQPSGCVQVVDLDVNPDSPYNPRRRLSEMPSSAASRGKKRTVGDPGPKRPRVPAK